MENVTYQPLPQERGVKPVMRNIGSVGLSAFCNPRVVSTAALITVSAALVPMIHDAPMMQPVDFAVGFAGYAPVFGAVAATALKTITPRSAFHLAGSFASALAMFGVVGLGGKAGWYAAAAAQYAFGDAALPLAGIATVAFLQAAGAFNLSRIAYEIGDTFDEIRENSRAKQVINTMPVITAPLLAAPDGEDFAQEPALLPAIKAKGVGADIIRILGEYGINDAAILGKASGHVLDVYTVSVPGGVKSKELEQLAGDLANRLGVPSVSVQSRGAGRGNVFVQVPRSKRETVDYDKTRKMADAEFAKCALPMLLGVDVSGKPVVRDLASAPHMLIAGQTGSGKSVGLNAILLSLVESDKAHVRLVLIDPKKVELTAFESVPHLLRPIITEAEEASAALLELAAHMDRRYQMFLEASRVVGHPVRNIGEYNAVAEKLNKPALPYIVCVIDEYADLVMVNPEVSKPVVRLGQKARAAGMHVIIGTQKPLATVIDSLIKANFPTRIAFSVRTNMDSRVILDEAGAEKLLGMGDSLLLDSSTPEPLRVHGVFASSKRVSELANKCRSSAV
ncbi:MAG: DNA translocase FtsK [Thiothrix sp.]|uniref:DNA translocase FtsK n=1 Tax=Thiothrix sp. TaxID=1032 RepID=UPI0026391E9F|nr:DNA translocase FtsK [Thiothrix sp.]MDD5392416.1 DNA translocase FtsK [Thiothrix sp.]